LEKVRSTKYGQQPYKLDIEYFQSYTGEAKSHPALRAPLRRRGMFLQVLRLNDSTGRFNGKVVGRN
jgi:hypothetical protein